MKPIILLSALSACAARAQTFTPTDVFIHAANFGWVSFSPSIAGGASVNETTLSGHAWSANMGWIHLGDGQTHHYANTTATNYGVNVAADGKLTGFAWAPNAGWINFEQTHGQARVDMITGQFHGHAWCPNAGWMSLEGAGYALRTASIAVGDTDNDGLGDAWEMRHFGNLTVANATTNADADPASDLDEYRAGTAPQDAADWLQLVSQSLAPSGNSATIRFTTAPGRLYRIESSAILDGTWSTASPGTFAPDAGGVTEKTFAIPAGARRFFRVTAVRPLP